MINISESQKRLAESIIEKKTFLEGPAGSGKTTIAKAFIGNLASRGIPGSEILILVPQRSLGITYQQLISKLQITDGTYPNIQTLGGIAQRMIRLFWPAIAENAGFAKSFAPPNFLTLESAQYYLARICEPFFERGYFETVHVEKPRILSQILDNLNKPAVVGFPHTDFAERLKSAWDKKPDHYLAFDEAQDCANAFRSFCYENNLLDFSLQIEVFRDHLWPSHLCQNYLLNTYRHIVYDNCEEDVPVVHDILEQWLPDLVSALIIFDQNAGFRTFLGADPVSAHRLKNHCEEAFLLEGSWIQSEDISRFETVISQTLSHQNVNFHDVDFFTSLNFNHHLFYPALMDSVAAQVEILLDQPDTHPGDISILAPYVSDALRFQIENRLAKLNISLITNRPSRSLREEPDSQVMITWAKIAHPTWQLAPSRYDVRTALTHSLGYIDPIRADLMARILFQSKSDHFLNSADTIQPEMRERFTYTASEQYARLREWIISYQQSPDELDVFWARFFGEVLSQPESGYYENYEAASVTARLIESFQKFRRVTTNINAEGTMGTAKEFIQMIESGIIAALYLDTHDEKPEDAVYLAPAHTFLMQNNPVKYQFWLDIGSMGWWQRLMQPLTQPYVLSRQWIPGKKWTDTHEYQINQANLSKLITGLLRRCENQVFLYTSGFNERGEEERGPLLQAIQRLLRLKKQWENSNNVSTSA